MKASPRMGAVFRSVVFSSTAASRQSVVIPIPAHRPHTENETMKK